MNVRQTLITRAWEPGRQRGGPPHPTEWLALPHGWGLPSATRHLHTQPGNRHRSPLFRPISRSTRYQTLFWNFLQLTDVEEQGEIFLQFAYTISFNALTSNDNFKFVMLSRDTKKISESSKKNFNWFFISRKMPKIV